MGKWEMVRLSELVAQTITGEWGTDLVDGELGTNVIRTTNFTNLGIISYKNVVVRSIPASKVDKKRLIRYDIILEKSGGSDNQPVGRVVFYDNADDDTYLCNNFTQILRINYKLAYSRYVFLYLYFLHLNGTTELLQNKTTGIRNLQVKRYMELPIPLPPLLVQQQIADVLDRASALIEKRKAQIAKLDLLVKSQFIEMFGSVKQMDKWACTKIGSVAIVSVGVVIKPAQYYTDKDSGIKAFRSLNIGEMRIKENNWVYFTLQGHAKNLKSELLKDDVLIVRSGAPGTACVVTKKYEGCNAIDVIIARPDKKIVNPVYLCAFTNSPYGKRQIEQGTGGAAQQHFNVGKYKDMTITLPPLPLQTQFADFVHKVEAQKAVLQQSLAHMEQNYKSLMQKCFRGEIF